MITAEQLREILHYDPETGHFTWLKRAARRTIIGGIAGWLDRDGYRIIMIARRGYPAHRLVWLWVHGKWPKAKMDHLNCVPDDNRFVNLREADDLENARNRRRPNNNTSGFKGVHFDKKWRKWRSYITADRLRHHLGSFDTREEAYVERCRAVRELHRDFSRME